MTWRTRRASFLMTLSGRVKKTGARSRTSARKSMEWYGGQLLCAGWRVPVNGLACRSPFSTGDGFSVPSIREPVIRAPVLIAFPAPRLKGPSALRERPSRIHQRRSDYRRGDGRRTGRVGHRRLLVVVLVSKENVSELDVVDQPFQVLGVAFRDHNREACGDSD